MLLKQVDDELTHEKAMKISAYQANMKDECDNLARELVGQAIARCAADATSEATVSVVPLPSDEMKGRIIGREGRNIRALETATGCDLIIDDTPEAITLSSFDQTRREVARMALERLIADGRIHPARIEETVDKCRRELEIQMKREGDKAVMELGIHSLHPDLVKLIGRLKYRTSFGQNVLSHSLEVAWLAGLMAGELGVNVQLARRAGLLHDIGTYFLLKQDGSDGEPLKFDGPHYVQHGLKGYEYLLNEGVDESIAQFARNHTGVGLTRETVESQGLPLPPADYVPMNLEQEVVMVADKYNSKSIPPKFLTAEAYTRKAARFGESNKREWLRLLERYGVLDVKPLAEQYHMRIAE